MAVTSNSIIEDIVQRMLCNDPQLSRVDLRHHQIKDDAASLLANALKHNTTVLSLDLRDNDITHFSMDWCFTNHTLQKLYLSGNPIRSPPKAVCYSMEDVMKFVEDLKRGASRLTTVKAMILGHGGAGKTTLKNRVLLDKQCLSTG